MKKTILLVLLALLLPAACSPIIQPATPTPPRPTEGSPKPTVGWNGEIKSGFGTPAPDWNGVPLVPEAIQGKPSGLSYLYSAAASIEEVEAFYLRRLAAEDWELSQRQEEAVSAFGGPGIILEFRRGEELVNITMFYSTSGNYTMVMLTGGAAP